jgi:hypothetical protein
VFGGGFGQKSNAAAAAAGSDKYGIGQLGGSKWDMPLPSASAKELPPANNNQSNFPSVAGGRSSFIRNARYAPGVNPSSVSRRLLP